MADEQKLSRIFEGNLPKDIADEIKAYLDGSLRPTEAERRTLMARYLDACYSIYKNYMLLRQRHRPSQTEFVREYLGLNKSNFSGWINRDRLPEGSNVDVLADKLTSDVYVIAGVPPRVSSDPGLFVIQKLYPNLSAQKRKKALEFLQKLANDEIEIIT